MKEREYSPCCLAAIDYHMAPTRVKEPRQLVRKPEAFMRAMRSLQIDLIRCHFPYMDEATKKRARATIEQLHEQLADG